MRIEWHRRQALIIGGRAVGQLVPTLSHSPALQSSIVGATLFIAFSALRSRVYTGVDGALRCLEVFHRQEIFFHGNNHLLYPVDVLLWHRLLSLFGFRAASPFDYLAFTQVMNAAAAAGCAAVLYWLVHQATASWQAALAAAALWSFSRAFLLHATNAAEPMVGILWSALAILLLALSRTRRRVWIPFTAGALLALAMATYESTILIAPLAVALCWSPRDSARETLHAFVRRLLAVAMGGLTGLITIYGFAYSAMGISGIGPKVERFRGVTGYGSFGGLSARNTALLPLGLAADLITILPQDFVGLRSLRSPGALAVLASASLAVVALALIGSMCLWRTWPHLRSGERTAFVYAIVGLAATLLGPMVWEPLYDKLWLQPLGCASFLAVLAAKRLPPARWRTYWRFIGTVALLAIVGSNLAWVIPAHRRETPYLTAAKHVAELTGERDLVVHDWDEISVLYGSIWGANPRRYRFDFPSSAINLRSRVRTTLDRAVGAARQRGAQVYFLGLLDQTKASWDVLLGKRAEVPFEVLAPYRSESRVVASFPYRRTVIHLYLWQGLPSLPPGSRHHAADAICRAPASGIR